MNDLTIKLHLSRTFRRVFFTHGVVLLHLYRSDQSAIQRGTLGTLPKLFCINARHRFYILYYKNLGAYCQYCIENNTIYLSNEYKLVHCSDKLAILRPGRRISPVRTVYLCISRYSSNGKATLREVLSISRSWASVIVSLLWKC
jgi:hypothetical protein